jgi:serine/threonine protein phosphatase PrpC
VSAAPPPPPTAAAGESRRVVVRLYGATDVGHTREHNEDCFLAADLAQGTPIAFGDGTEERVLGAHGLLLMVADGMGGAAAGELASAMATTVVLEAMRSGWLTRDPLDERAFAEALRDATETANARIHDHARANPELRGMGTTATIAGVWRDRVFIAQVGDSRAYLRRDGRLHLLTRDQSLLQRLVDAGELSAAQAETSTRRNIILQALGPDARVRVDLTVQALRHGDTLLLCSDGLSGVAAPHELEAAAAEEPDPAVLAHRLIALANARGGPDNITVLVAHVSGDGLTAARDGDRVGHNTYPLARTLAEEDGARGGRGTGGLGAGSADAARTEGGTDAGGAATRDVTGWQADDGRVTPLGTAADRPMAMPGPPAADHPPAPDGAFPIDAEARRARAARAFPIRLLLLLLGLALAGVLLYQRFIALAPD